MTEQTEFFGSEIVGKPGEQSRKDRCGQINERGTNRQIQADSRRIPKELNNGKDVIYAAEAGVVPIYIGDNIEKSNIK